MFHFSRFDEIFCWLCLICLPLGLWKAAEILIWVCRHLHWSA